MCVCVWGGGGGGGGRGVFHITHCILHLVAFRYKGHSSVVMPQCVYLSLHHITVPSLSLFLHTVNNQKVDGSEGL